MNSWLNVTEAARFLKCSKSTVYRLCKSRALSFTKKSIGLRIRTQDLEAWLNEGKRKARATNFLLTAPLKIDSYSPGGNTEMAKAKSKTRGRYGFDHVYVRTYKSGRSCWTIDYVTRTAKGYKRPWLTLRAEKKLSSLSSERSPKSLTESMGLNAEGRTSDSQPSLRSIFKIMP